MLIDILSVACGFVLGFGFIIFLELIIDLIRNVICRKKIVYKPTKVFTHDNKQFQKIERKEKTKK